MARSKKHRRHAEKHLWPDNEVDESPFARVTADMVTRGQFSFASPQADEELQKSRFLASTAGLLVLKGDAAPSPMEMPADGSALAEAIAAHRRADAEVRRLRDELAALKATLAEHESALAQARQARKTEAELHEPSAQALQEMRAQAEAAREAADAQMRSVRDELAALRATLADRESALAQASLDHEQARATWEHASRASLSNTEREWKDAEAARMAEVESKWQEQSERSLAELRAQADAARDRAERDMQALRDDVAALRSTLTEREAALAQSASDRDQAQARWQQENQAALSKAEQVWKSAEAARFADAETKWQEHTAKALDALRSEADKTRESAEATIRGLQEQVSAAQTALVEREAALAAAGSEAQRTREQARKDLDGVLEKMKAWQADEAQRMAAAEAKWKQQSAAALSEAQGRYQAAEGTLVQLRMEADRARSNATGGSINPSRSSASRSTFGSKAVAREPEPAAIRLPGREPRAQAKQEQIVLQPHRVLEDPYAPKKRGIWRDLLVVAALAVVAIMVYPRIEPLIPEPWRSQIAALTGGFASPSSVVAQGSAVVVRDVNLRSGPSTSASIITTLVPGQNVATLARREEWTFVEVAADSRSTQPQRGWVFSSFLKDDAANAEEDGETADSESTE